MASGIFLQRWDRRPAGLPRKIRGTRGDRFGSEPLIPISAAAGATINGNTLTARVTTPHSAGYQQHGMKTITARRFVGASAKTFSIVKKGLKSAGVRAFRGRRK